MNCQLRNNFVCFSSKWTASYGECSGRIVSILNNTVCLWMIISTSKSNIVRSFITFILSEIYHFLGVDFKHILTLEYPNFNQFKFIESVRIFTVDSSPIFFFGPKPWIQAPLIPGARREGVSPPCQAHSAHALPAFCKPNFHL